MIQHYQLVSTGAYLWSVRLKSIQGLTRIYLCVQSKAYLIQLLKYFGHCGSLCRFLQDTFVHLGM